MKNILLLLLLIISNVSISQIPISSPSGIYELRESAFKKIVSIEYETLVPVDTVTGIFDYTDVRYDIKCNQEFIFSFQPEIEDEGLRILIVYSDYSAATKFIPIKEFQKTDFSFKYKTNKTEITILLDNEKGSIGPVIIVTLPILYLGKEAIVHLRPHTK
jgi:hypothetical protein